MKNIIVILKTAFQSIANGRPLHVPLEISKEFVKHVEEAVNVSYSNSETFSLVNKEVIF